MFKFVARLFNKSATEAPADKVDLDKARETLGQIMQIDNPDDDALAFELARTINANTPSLKR